jgi:hypothetical protein
MRLPYKLPYLCHQALMLRVLRYSPKPVANITHTRQISEAIPRDERPNAPNDAPNEAPWRRLDGRNRAVPTTNFCDAGTYQLTRNQSPNH